MAGNEDTHPRQLEIKKYPNRRYYDATRSRHLTMEDIRSLVREGYDIRVTDSKTSADITAKVLAQIILELDAEKIDAFPVALLVRLIRANDQLVKDFVDRYFNQALSMFLQYRQQFEEQLRGGKDGFGSLYSSIANWNRAMMNPFNLPFMGGMGANPGEPGNSPKPEAATANLQNKVISLEQQIANLEAKLAGAAQPRKSKAKKAKSGAKV